MGTEATVRIGSGPEIGSGLEMGIEMTAVRRCCRHRSRSSKVHTNLAASWGTSAYTCHIKMVE